MLYEIKKLFSSPFTYICMLVVFVFFSVFAVNALKSRNSSNNAYEELLADINNSKMSDEEILIDLYSQFELLQIQINELGDSAFEKPGKYGKNIMEDYIIYSNAYSNASYIYQKFPNNRRQLVEDALYNISEEKSKTDPNTSVIKSNELVIEKYNRTIDLKFKDTGNIEGVQLFFDNTIWEYAMIAFVVMLVVRMFTMDISCGAYKMIHSSLNGQRSLFIKQFASVSVVVTAITVFTALIQIIFGKIFFDVNDLSLPLQSFPEFEFCPYLISTGIYFLIKFLCKLLFYIMIAAITAMVSVLCRKQFVSYAVSLSAGIIPLIIITYYFIYTTENASALASEYKIYNSLRCFLPQGLLNIKSYFRTFDYIDIFGFQISRLFLVLLISAVIMLTCLAVALRKYGKSKEVTI